MSTTQYISVRETAQVLSISEKKVMDLIESQKLQAYKIADKFLRLKKSEVLNLRNSNEFETDQKVYDYTTGERFKDFLYYNDFYIFCTLLMAALLAVILMPQ